LYAALNPHDLAGGASMTIDEILNELEAGVNDLPREALREAIAQQEAITPDLLRILVDAVQDPEPLIYDDGKAMLFLYALYLLAQFREKRAYPLIVELCSAWGDTLMDVAGDVVTEDMGRILASVCWGDITLIQSLVENPEVNEYVRGAAMRALTVLVGVGELSRDALMGYFQELFRTLPRYFDHIWGVLVSSSLDIYSEEVMDEIRQAFAEDLVDTLYVDLEFVEDVLDEGKDQVLEDLRTESRLITDVIAEMEPWALYDRYEQLGLSDAKPSSPTLQAQPMRSTPKVGRNEPCLCGSGKKFKHCCGSAAARSGR
jgi:hypothetical protein